MEKWVGFIFLLKMPRGNTKIYHNMDCHLTLNIDIVVQILTFCLSSNCFIFNNVFYYQINGTPMGFPSSVIITEIVMKYIQVKINAFF